MEKAFLTAVLIIASAYFTFAQSKNSTVRGNNGIKIG